MLAGKFVKRAGVNVYGKPFVVNSSRNPLHVAKRDDNVARPPSLRTYFAIYFTGKYFSEKLCASSRT